MDSVSLIMGLAVVALLVLPFLYLQLKHKKKNAKLLQDFLSLAAQQQLNISQHDLWGPGFAIGIDAVQHKLFFTKTQDAGIKSVVVDLKKVATCKVNTNSEEVNGNKIINQIDLRFSYNSHAKQPDTNLTFYQKEESLNLGEELLLAQKWMALVTANLQTIKPAAPANKGVNDSAFAMA